MDLPNWNIDSEYLKIPKVFQSFLEEGPFRKCLICERLLLQEGTQYLIEKAYKKEEVILEYAICISCIVKFRDTYSLGSRQVIEHYFSERVDLVGRSEKFQKLPNPMIKDWLKDCIFTNKPLHKINEYHIYAHCEGENLILSCMPFGVDTKVIQEVYEKLSRKTKNENDRFISDYLNKLPDFDSILNGPKLVLV